MLLNYLITVYLNQDAVHDSNGPVSFAEIENNMTASMTAKSDVYDTCSQGCSLANSKHEILSSIYPKNPTNECTQNFYQEFGSVNVASEDLNSEENTLGKSFKIMLMNIADETKKTQLMKVRYQFIVF